YGSVRRWVRSLTLLTGEGEQLSLRRENAAGHHTNSPALTRFHAEVAPRLRSATSLISRRFPRTRKNSSGYALDSYIDSGDVLDLIIGAEGTLGVVTQITWRLGAIPPFRAGMRARLTSLDSLSDAVLTLSRFEPSAVELLDQSFLDLLGPGTLEGAGLDTRAEAILLIELEGDEPEALRQALSDAAAAIAPWVASIEIADSPADTDRLWSLRHAASPILAGLPEDRRSLQVIEDGCVPVERMGEYIRTVRRLAADRELQVVMFGHAGDGHVHVNLLPELARANWEAQVAGLLEEATAAVIRLGGTPAGEHGDGRLRAATLLDVYGAEIVELFRAVKDAFDPRGIFNPGIILPTGEPPISRLKVGAGAVTIPPDLQSALREIELTGGYGRRRLELADQSPVASRQCE
ncbi:MAG TPA: FAD-linked oxidase C-terminal domain-containing protein, partial [Gemmatimonadales bacterium]|nr:FAD-linked oxidase C-terminal domain-containing protein [Gemmatimonadales bacterium]